MKRLLLTAILLMLLALPAAAADVIRYKIPNSDFPIAQAVEIPAGQNLVFLSGAGPRHCSTSRPTRTARPLTATRRRRR